MNSFKDTNLDILFDILNINNNFVQNDYWEKIKEDLQFGIGIRINILIENIIGINDELIEKNNFTLTMHINSLYIHIKGILDNLASIINIQLELDIEPKNNIVLNNKKFKNKLKSKSENLHLLIEKEFNPWLEDIKNKRDPIAHRKPLYVPPGIITNKEEFKKLSEINENILKENDPKKIFSHVVDWQNHSPFKPFVIQHDNSKCDNIDETITDDIKNLFKMYKKIMQEITHSHRPITEDEIKIAEGV